MKMVRFVLFMIMAVFFLASLLAAVFSLSVHHLVDTGNVSRLLLESALPDQLLGQVVAQSRLYRLAALDPGLPFAISGRIRTETGKVAEHWLAQANDWLYRRSERFAPVADLKALKADVIALIAAGLNKTSMAPVQLAAYRRAIGKEMEKLPERLELVKAVRLPAVVSRRISMAALRMRAFLSWHAVLLVLPLTAFSLALALAPDRRSCLHGLSLAGMVLFGCAAAVPLFYHGELKALLGVLGSSLGVRGLPAREAQSLLVGEWLDVLRNRLVICYLVFLVWPLVSASRALLLRVRMRGGVPSSHAR
jgi:hypothetical protein